MTEEFLVRFMHAAQEVTKAERLLAVDANMMPVDSIDLEQDEIDSDEFKAILEPNLKQAIERGEVIITNNLITGDVKAPTTNTNFSELRFVILIPIGNVGAIYLDKRVRMGMIAREAVDKLRLLALRIIDSGYENNTAEQIVTWYRQM
jgi:hypothetical protein